MIKVLENRLIDMNVDSNEQVFSLRKQDILFTIVDTIPANILKDMPDAELVALINYVGDNIGLVMPWHEYVSTIITDWEWEKE